MLMQHLVSSLSLTDSDDTRCVSSWSLPTTKTLTIIRETLWDLRLFNSKLKSKASFIGSVLGRLLLTVSRPPQCVSCISFRLSL